MNDDWKGEEIIRRKPTKAERNFRSQSVAQSMAHKRRAAKGENMAALGGPWARAIHAWHVEGRVNSGKSDP